MLTRQPITEFLLSLGFTLQSAEQSLLYRGALQVTILDAPRLAIAGPHGLLYVALLSAEHLREQLDALPSQPQYQLA